MAKQTINPGTAPTGIGGDTFRSGSAKLQANDDEIYAQLGGTGTGNATLPAALPIAKGGTGAITAAAALTNLGLNKILETDKQNNITRPISGGGAFHSYIGRAQNTAYLSYAVVGSSKTGILALKFSKKGISSIPVIVLRGFSTGFGAWQVTVVFYHNGSASTSMHQAYIEGNLPSEVVRVSFDLSENMHVLIGQDSTVWNYTTVIVEDIFNLYSGDTVADSFINSTSLYYLGSTAEMAYIYAVPVEKPRTTLNTTVDSNGFIKAASPVVQIFADKIELNGEAKQQEITFEKLGVGDYLIQGSSGFAQEGWYVETPKDANGNVLFSVIYDTLENGDISVKTYEKKFDLKTASIVADLDKPVDITEGRWIDIRLQQLPQTEIEVVDDPEQ